GSARDLEASFLEEPGERAVAQGFRLVLGLDELLDHAADVSARLDLAILVLHPAGEEVAHLEEPVGRLHVLPFDRTADRREMDAHHVGDRLHLERLEVLGAVDHELPLELRHRDSDVVKRSLSLVDRLDQPLRRLDLLADEVGDLTISAMRLEEVAASIAHLELGKVPRIDAHLDLAVDDIDPHVGANVDRRLALEMTAGEGIEARDDLDRFFDLLDGASDVPRDLGQLVLAEILQVTKDDLALERVVLRIAFELEEKAVLEVLGSDAGGVEVAHGREGRFERLGIELARQRLA